MLGVRSLNRPVPTMCLAAVGRQEVWFRKEMLIYVVRTVMGVQWDTLFDKVSEDIQDRGIELRWHLVYQMVRQLILQE